MEQIFIDRFIVPRNAKAEFTERMQINRSFIKQLPGFVNDEAYERTDDEGNFICVTIAIWASEEALKNAKERVQAEYQQQGFNLPGMLQRLNIRMERGQYNRFSN
jgi:heme-degrading monooxygenase HmoA